MNYSASEFYKTIKRAFDILFSVFIIIAISPLLILISLCVKFEDGGPVVFKQKRSGQNGKMFYIYKFRSMKVQPGQKKNTKSQYNWLTRVPDDFVFKMTDDFDPNVTKIGRFLRKSSLDELPQFFNVVKGEMSIVGPRPEIIEITNCYDAEQFQRLLVKPGITGWAQVNGRSEMNHGRKVELDLVYIENQTFLQDMKIIAMTIKQTFFGKGAI